VGRGPICGNNFYLIFISNGLRDVEHISYCAIIKAYRPPGCREIRWVKIKEICFWLWLFGILVQNSMESGLRIAPRLILKHF
jgi:hypothetical protein